MKCMQNKLSLDLLDSLEGILLELGLESSVTELGGGIDELEGNLLEITTGSVGKEGLPESHDSLLDTDARSLDHDEVVLDDTVSDESSHRGDLVKEATRSAMILATGEKKCNLQPSR